MTATIPRGIITMLVMLGLLLALPANGAAQSSATATIRVIHSSPGTPAVDVFLNGQRVITGLSYTEASPYMVAPAGTHEVQLSPTGSGPDSEALLSASVTLDEGTTYTAVGASNSEAELTVALLVDDLAQPADGQTRVRLVHTAVDVPHVDVAVLDSDLVLPNVGFGAASAYAPIAPGTYRLEARLPGTTEPVFTSNPVELTLEHIYTVVIQGEAANSTLQVVTYLDDPPRMPATGGGGTSNPDRSGLPGDALLAGGLLSLLGLIALAWIRKITVFRL